MELSEKELRLEIFMRLSGGGIQSINQEGVDDFISTADKVYEWITKGDSEEE